VAFWIGSLNSREVVKGRENQLIVRETTLLEFSFGIKTIELTGIIRLNLKLA
jgi:hypothetical protein